MEFTAVIAIEGERCGRYHAVAHNMRVWSREAVQSMHGQQDGKVTVQEREDGRLEAIWTGEITREMAKHAGGPQPFGLGSLSVGTHIKEADMPERSGTEEIALERLLAAVATMFANRYELDLVEIQVPEELEDAFPCPVAVNLGELSEAWGAVLELRGKA